MNPNELKKILSWIADHGIDAYTAEAVMRDLNIPEDSIFKSGHEVIKVVLLESINSAMLITEIEIPKTSDELFDLILTFLENLNDYGTEFQAIINCSTVSFDYIKLTSVCDEITCIIFKPYVETFFDKLTYNLIMANIFYTWINDDTQDLSMVSDKINHISKSIFIQN